MKALCLSAVLLAAACAAEDTATRAAAPQTCKLTPAATLPMLGRTAYAVVPAQLNGQDVAMLIDTGNEHLSVTPRAVRTLRLARDPHRRTTVIGVGGRVTSEDAVIDNFVLGGVNLYQSDASVADVPLSLPNVPDLMGLIGADTLEDYDVEMDFASRRVTLWDRSGCETVTPPWPPGYTGARLTRGMRSLLTLDVTVNGQKVPALFDTGAQTSTIAPGAAARIGIGGAALHGARVMTSRGADASDIIARVSRGHEVAVGTIRATGMALLVSDVRVPFADMMLGVDFLRHRDVWLSYRTQMLFLR